MSISDDGLHALGSTQEFIYKGQFPESTGDMNTDWELPNKEQELIRAIQRENSDARACARELVEEYDWGLAKVSRILDN